MAIVGLLLAVPAAHATEVRGPAKYQRYADIARVPTTPFVTRVKVGPCPWNSGYYGCTYRWRWVIHMRGWVGPWGFWHELGHRFDYDVLKPRHRRKIKRLLGATGAWETEGRDSPAEQFAEAYAGCALAGRRGMDLAVPLYGLSVKRSAHWRICRVVWRAS